MKRADIEAARLAGQHLAFTRRQQDWLNHHVQRVVVEAFVIKGAGYRGGWVPVATDRPAFARASVRVREVAADGTPYPRPSTRVVPVGQLKGLWEEVAPVAAERQRKIQEALDERSQTRSEKYAKAKEVAERAGRLLGPAIAEKIRTDEFRQNGSIVVPAEVLELLLDRLDELTGEGRVHQDRT